MSYLGEVYVLPRNSIKKLEKIHSRASDEAFGKKLHEFLTSEGENIGYNYSGSVITDLVYFYLKDKKGIDLEKGEMSRLMAEVGDKQADWLFLYVLLGYSDREHLLPKLDPAIYSAQEMQERVEQLYGSEGYDGYGTYMMETLKFIHSGLKDLNADQFLCIVVVG